MGIWVRRPAAGTVALGGMSLPPGVGSSPPSAPRDSESLSLVAKACLALEALGVSLLPRGGVPVAPRGGLLIAPRIAPYCLELPWQNGNRGNCHNGKWNCRGNRGQ